MNAVVSVVEDDPVVRMTVQSLVRTVGLTAQGFATGGEFMRSYQPSQRGCLILDLRLPDMSGIQLIEALALQHHYFPPTVMITGHGHVQAAVSAMQAGVLNFIEKPFRPADLLEQVQKAVEADAEHYQRFERRAAIAQRLKRLSLREKQVLAAVLAGKPNKQIAVELQLSFKTVSWHRITALKKLEVESIFDLANQDWRESLATAS